MDFDINTKGKDLFLTLSTISLIIMMVITTLLWWFISPRLHEISNILAGISLTILRIFYLVLILGTTLVYLTCYLEKNFLIAKFAVSTFIRVLFPVTIFLGTMIGINKDRIRVSFVHVNNSFIKAMKKKFSVDSILILLPHCLQNTECDIRITFDINNCKDCGKCSIYKLKQLSKQYNIRIAIATGGTLARKIIVENKPKLVIAVACQRDLVSGIQEVYPIPTFGILNERPFGPCINTTVAIDSVEHAIKNLVQEA
ncbi:DUF116 domain-containing protein [Candidatus Cloacimonadota bacterium]